MTRHGSVEEKDQDSGVGRVGDGEQVAGRGQNGSQYPGPGGLVHDREPRAKGIAKGLAQAQEGN
jgi:hypothetical protein